MVPDNSKENTNHAHYLISIILTIEAKDNLVACGTVRISKQLTTKEGMAICYM